MCGSIQPSGRRAGRFGKFKKKKKKLSPTKEIPASGIHRCVLNAQVPPAAISYRLRFGAKVPGSTGAHRNALL